MSASHDQFDIVVMGAGNAGLCAAISAAEYGKKVLILERAPANFRGGNSYFTGGLMRVPYNGLPDIKQLIPDLSEEEERSIEVGQYTADDFYEDILRLGDYRCDADLVNCLVSEAFPTLKWMREKGVRFTLQFGRQAFKVGDRYRFWGGAILGTVGGGVGLIDRLFESAQKAGVEVWYEARADRLLTDHNGAVIGVQVKKEGTYHMVKAKGVILASGGFEANPEMRAKYLGKDWDLARVRGTPYNTGDGIRMALEIGAQPYGHWSGCHAVAWDFNAPPSGDRKIGELFQKHSYPLGIMVNKYGQRFVDEGADFRNYTYAKYGAEILKQPGHVAFQIFDSKVVDKLRDEYRIKEVTKAETQTIEELAEQLEIDKTGLVKTVQDFNNAVQEGEFNPAILDGKSTKGITPPKSNWALPLDTPPFVGFAVTCGITFTYGGLRVNTEAQVLDVDGHPIPGLYACGELVGGLFYSNYPGGSGLTSGAVFGRLAGRTAAQR